MLFDFSLQMVLEDLKAIDDNPLVVAIISDLQVFAGGLMGLNFLKQYIPESSKFFFSWHHGLVKHK